MNNMLILNHSNAVKTFKTKHGDLKFEMHFGKGISFGMSCEFSTIQLN